MGRISDRVKGYWWVQKAAVAGDQDAVEMLTVWDSVCIQVRGQHTPFWGAYKDLVDNFLYGHLESLGANEKLALWAQTEEGWDWVEDHYADEDGRTTAPLDDSGILGYLRAAVLATADQYENEVINRSLFPDSCQE